MAMFGFARDGCVFDFVYDAVCSVIYQTFGLYEYVGEFDQAM